MKKKVVVRSGIWTHALDWGPECYALGTGKLALESGALDRSAILTENIDYIKSAYALMWPNH